MIKLLALLIVSTLGHGRVGKDIYNSHLVNTDPVQTPEMKLFIRKNRFKMENCLRYAGIRYIKLQKSHQISAYCQNKSASRSYSSRTSFGIENMPNFIACYSLLLIATRNNRRWIHFANNLVQYLTDEVDSMWDSSGPKSLDNRFIFHKFRCKPILLVLAEGFGGIDFE